ncbi:MAG TPA: AAA family ATPase [Candidatus Binataceae bacterium]|nr:AAA family ATPase [Candidatus Binataceae bacterium]
MQYYQYFRLKGPPFQPASPDAAVYLSPTHIQGLATLESGISTDLTGLTLLTGEAGTGKTTLIYSLLQRDYKRVRIAHIDDPKLSFPEIMRAVLTQFNLYSTGSDKLDYLEALDRLLDLHGDKERIAIIVDEAQVLSDDVLEELRLLSNRGQRNDRRLQLILVGQPELADRLKKPHLRQLNQRISSRGVLNPLTSQQAIKYVECKLSAQGSNVQTIFARGALKRLLKRSDGIPRKINMLCHTAMEAAYLAGERKVSYKTAVKVASQYYDSVKIERQGIARWAMPALMGAAGLAALLLAATLYPMVAGWMHRVPSGKAVAQSLKSVARPKPIARVEPLAPSKQTEQTKMEMARPAAAANPVLQPVSATNSQAGATTSESQRPELRQSLSDPVPPAAAVAPAAAPAAPAPAAPATSKGSLAAATTQAIRMASVSPASAAETSTAQKAAATPTLRRNQITVRYGDTLEKIAIRYFGSKAGVSELVSANPQLGNINQLTVGETIYLPPGVSPRAVHADTAADEAASGSDSAADNQ